MSGAVPWPVKGFFMEGNPHMGQRSILRVSRVSKRFGRRSILRDVSLDVEEGEILAIIGSSGSGKTTLLKSMIGFNIPEEGDVKFRRDAAPGSAVKRVYSSVFSAGLAAKKVFGFASQDPSFYENLTVKENLVYFGSLYGLEGKSLDSNADILIELMGLKAAEKTLGCKLSGGMQRRLDIACALIHGPEILILDEPTSDLDPVLRTHILNIIRKINRRGTTVIMASHHLSEVEALCSRIAIIKEGQLIDVDTPTRLKAKYERGQDISLQTYPGDYHGIYQAVKTACPEVSGTVSNGGVVIRARHPKATLEAVWKALDELDEELVDIRVSKPGLDELFLKLTRSEQ